MYEIHHKECLEHMATMPAQSVDAILTDLPYGTTACAWDVVIPFEPMWEAVKHVLKPDGAFVTTASQPFTSLLVASNLKWFRYEWIWRKGKGSNFLLVKYQPFKIHEEILIFSQNTAPYNFQLRELTDNGKARNNRNNYTKVKMAGSVYSGSELEKFDYTNKTHGYPVSIIQYNQESNNQFKKPVSHPTQKPVALYKYLVQTYTNPGDTVLDMCMGSGTTGEACIELGRNFIGCETEKEHFLTAQERLIRVSRQGQLFGSPANNAMNSDPKSAAQKSLFN